ncbi:hypothetical protein SPHINGO8AM_130137 [Sphingomonas sp. 8AM]|nr:hypothetical protein SPHINGO8AM_130137 [Sphingomonas sp. 8AM]
MGFYLIGFDVRQWFVEWRGTLGFDRART